MVAFSQVQTIYIYMFVAIYEYALHTQLRRLCPSRGLGQLMGMARKRMHAQALQESCVAYELELIASYCT